MIHRQRHVHALSVWLPVGQDAVRPPDNPRAAAAAARPGHTDRPPHSCRVWTSAGGPGRGSDHDPDLPTAVLADARGSGIPPPAGSGHGAW
ncbi:MAG TPA: hypothetical protein VHN80_12605 [Kineosporiaceae bacterium]|nr:hypothetical protein [Kineosporiaceae bacterium]